MYSNHHAVESNKNVGNQQYTPCLYYFSPTATRPFQQCFNTSEIYYNSYTPPLHSQAIAYNTVTKSFDRRRHHDDTPGDLCNRLSITDRPLHKFAMLAISFGDTGRISPLLFPYTRLHTHKQRSIASHHRHLLKYPNTYINSKRLLNIKYENK